MPKISYWTQPNGHIHITSAKGKTNIAYVEIEKGPYLVKPVEDAFRESEYPYNIHANNIIWKNFKNYQEVDVWKKNDIVSGKLVKFKRNIEFSNNNKNVVISGKVKINNHHFLSAGSYFYSENKGKVSVKCLNEECVIYVKPIS